MKNHGPRWVAGWAKFAWDPVSSFINKEKYNYDHIPLLASFPGTQLDQVPLLFQADQPILNYYCFQGHQFCTLLTEALLLRLVILGLRGLTVSSRLLIFSVSVTLSLTTVLMNTFICTGRWNIQYIIFLFFFLL